MDNDDDLNNDPQEETEQINSTILEFLSTFHGISADPQSITDLTDGVALFEALSEMYVVYVCVCPCVCHWCDTTTTNPE